LITNQARIDQDLTGSAKTFA